MNKKIIILNGAARKNGSTAKLVEAFADGGDYSQVVTWYRTYERNLSWKNLGEVLGKGKTKEAYQLGASI